MTIILALFLTTCNSIEVKNSRDKLLDYSNSGYKIKLNDSLIDITHLILDESKIKTISIDRFHRIVTIKHQDNDLITVPFNWIASSKNNELLLVDDVVLKSEEIDSTLIEYSAFRGVKVLNDAKFSNKTYKKITWVTSKE